MKGVVAVMALAVVAGCAITAPAPVSEHWTRWVCDSQAQVFWRFADAAEQTVDVRLGGADQVYRLASEPGASGALYSDGVLAFHTKGDEGVVYWVATNDLIGRGCKAP